MDNIETLKKIVFFSSLSQEHIEKIAELTITRNYKKDMLIFVEGEPGEAFYFIKKGNVKVYRSYPDGREHILSILGEGNVFAEATLFTGISYPASASAYEDCTIGMIKNSDMENMVVNTPTLALALIKVMSQKLIFSQQKIRDLTFSDVFARTAAELLKLSEQFGKEDKGEVKITVEFSRQQLAELVGTTRETISRVISKFKKEKAIREEGNNIVITDSDKLSEWI